MIRMNDWTLSFGSLLAMIALAGGGTTAWVDVKSDITANSTNIEQESERSKRIEDKLDKIYDHLLDKQNKEIQE
jgi:hypothetical protein